MINTVDQVKIRARGVVVDQIESRSNNAGAILQAHVTNLRSMGHTLRSQGLDNTADLVDSTAERLGSVSTYLTQTDGDRMVRDIESLAQEYAIVTASIGFLAGLMAARLFKASASERQEDAQ